MQLGTWCPENMSEIDALADVANKAQDAFAQDLAPIAGPEQLGPVSAQPAQEDPHEAVQHKRLATLAELRKKSSNTLHLSGIVMDDRMVQIQGRIIQEFMLVGRRSYAADLTQQKRRRARPNGMLPVHLMVDTRFAWMSHEFWTAPLFWARYACFHV